MSAAAAVNDRLTRRFAELRARGEVGLVAYLTAYDPDRAASLQLLLQAARGGADVLEIGVPWSDPSADGPVIQRAMLRGLAAGSSLRGVLELIAEVRRQVDTPIVVFGYYNPILCYGPERFARDAAAAGADGVLVVDLPLEEAAELDPPLQAAGLRRVPLLAPTTPPERAGLVASGAACGGFAYYVALLGVTGAGNLDPAEVAPRLLALQQTVRLPLAVGFGVKDPASASALARLPGCAAVVVGSAIVQAAERGEDVFALVAGLKQAVAQPA